MLLQSTHMPKAVTASGPAVQAMRRDGFRHMSTLQEHPVHPRVYFCDFFCASTGKMLRCFALLHGLVCSYRISMGLLQARFFKQCTNMIFVMHGPPEAVSNLCDLDA